MILSSAAIFNTSLQNPIIERWPLGKRLLNLYRFREDEAQMREWRDSQLLNSP
jgi:hypothetical protein